MRAWGLGLAITLAACNQADEAPQAEETAAAGESAVAATGQELIPDRSADAIAEKITADESASIQTRLVVVEDDTSQPPDPTLKCEWPQRLRNKNNIAVKVDYTLHYRGNGAPNCNAHWSQPQDPIVLKKAGDTGSTYYVGCAVYHLPGGACTEYRNWEVDLATPVR